TLGSKFDPSESLNATSSSQNSLYLLAELSSILMNEAWWQILHKLSKLLKPYNEHVESFNYLIDEWENLLAQEVEAKQNENEDTDYDLEVDIDKYLLTQMHPAVDIGAKWYICEIFADNLEAPYDIN
ncbi:38858_t:CDS:2, partial [Gigaspora margarita]